MRLDSRDRLDIPWQEERERCWQIFLIRRVWPYHTFEMIREFSMMKNNNNSWSTFHGDRCLCNVFTFEGFMNKFRHNRFLFCRPCFENNRLLTDTVISLVLSRMFLCVCVFCSSRSVQNNGEERASHHCVEHMTTTTMEKKKKKRTKSSWSFCDIYFVHTLNSYSSQRWREYRVEHKKKRPASAHG